MKVKKCPDGKELNVSTNRCRKKCEPGTHRADNGRCVKSARKSSKSKPRRRKSAAKTQCPELKVINPLTGRCVMNRGYSETRPHPLFSKACPVSNQTRSPITGRCVLTSGTLGQRYKEESQSGKLKNLIKCKKCGDYALPLRNHNHLFALIFHFYFAKAGGKYWSAQRLGNRFNLDKFQVETIQRFLDLPKAELKRWMLRKCTDDEVYSVFGFEDPSDIRFNMYPLDVNKWDMRYFENYMRDVRNGAVIALWTKDGKPYTDKKEQEHFEERNRRAAREYAKHNNK
jgi:hypothetical protein